MKILNDQEMSNVDYICTNFYAKTKLGFYLFFIYLIDDDFLINCSAELINGKIAGYARIRSK